MPLIWLLKLLLSLLSLALAVTAAVLLWTWWQGVTVQDENGVWHLVREDWKLWIGVALLAWSALGRWPARFLVATPDGKAPHTTHGTGETIASPTGAQLHVERDGPVSGPTLVLVHGWGLDSTIWHDATQVLSRRFRVIRWDLPGLGKSRAGPGEPSLEGFALDLASLIDAVTEDKVVLVGHSIGGMTIQTLHRDHPEFFARRVSGVVLLNTTYTNPLETMILSPLMLALRPVILLAMRFTMLVEPLARLGAWQSYFNGSAHLANRLGFGRHVTRSQLEHTTLLQTRNSPRSQAKGNVAMIHWDATESLGSFSVPLLVVGGTLDIVTTIDASRTIAGAVPGARLREVEGVNHMGFLEKPTDYLEAIIGFAEGLASPADATTQSRPKGGFEEAPVGDYWLT